MEEARWYVVHTYSGYENKVAQNLTTIVGNRRLQDTIIEVRVPTEMVSDIKDGKEREVERKLFPGYVLVKMVMTNDSWYIVRNCRGVTGFVGPSSKPVPLSHSEAESLGLHIPLPVEGEETAKAETPATLSIDYAEGDSVEVLDGPLEGFIGTVERIDTAAAVVHVKVSMFGRETPAELALNQVKPV